MREGASDALADLARQADPPPKRHPANPASGPTTDRGGMRGDRPRPDGRSGRSGFDRKPFLLIRPGFRTRITRYRDLGRIVPRVARVLHDRGPAPGRPGHHLGRQPAGVGHHPARRDPRRGGPRPPRRPQRSGLRGQGRREDAGQPRVRLAADCRPGRGLGLPVVLIERIPDLARDCEPLPAADIGPDDLVEVLFTSRHDRGAEGGDADPPQPGVQRAGAAQGVSHRPE